MLAVGGDHELPFAPGLDAVFLHRASHALLAHADAVYHQFPPHLWPTIFLLDPSLDSPDVSQQDLIADSLVGDGLPAPLRRMFSE